MKLIEDLFDDIENPADPFIGTNVGMKVDKRDEKLSQDIVIIDDVKRNSLFLKNMHEKNWSHIDANKLVAPIKYYNIKEIFFETSYHSLSISNIDSITNKIKWNLDEIHIYLIHEPNTSPKTKKVIQNQTFNCKSFNCFEGGRFHYDDEFKNCIINASIDIITEIVDKEKINLREVKGNCHNLGFIVHNENVEAYLHNMFENPESSRLDDIIVGGLNNIKADIITFYIDNLHHSWKSMIFAKNKSDGVKKLKDGFFINFNPNRRYLDIL